MAIIFGDNSKISIGNLRYQALTKKVITARSFVQTDRLPPTESSTKFHCLRVYYQTMKWIDMASGMNPTNRGWKLNCDEVIPIYE